MSSPRNLTPTQASPLLAGDDTVLVDVRGTEEWQQGHAPSALHVPLDSLNPGDFTGRTVMAVCRSGRRSEMAVETLREAGIDACNVTGGMQAWAEAGFPVITDSGTAGSVR
jgi:rhodanese-related sulfurtransferase